ncbi:RNA polymerase sigma factor SigD [Planctomycetes bacterium Poly30]|uniref:RNA polymerase sigma factor SigD n=2 Tax=Saltatorellus ferox TaxID=2528018 RepID=A0A518ENR6_9BACT|nr:RNA polymerase sigma factor SigD [Planctomycetes bacterium Poly30]
MQRFQEQLKGAAAGDEVALNTLFERFYPVVQTMVHRRLAIELRAKRPWLLARFSTGDVVQEVFRSALRDLRAFSGNSEDAFAGYLAMIVRNRIVDSIRFHHASQRDRRKAVDENEAELRVSGEEDPSDSMEFDEEVGRYRAALETFEERERLLLRARFEKTHSFDALAEALGYSSPYAARRAFFKAQAILTQRLEHR